jgi:F-type H+-transporting ATPase subunit gamma
MANVLDLRRRIRSVKNTRQITKAMKLVSAAKLRRAQERAVSARPYGTMLASVIRSLERRIEIYDPVTGDVRHPLLLSRPEKTAALIVVSGDKGFAGAFNSNISKAALRFITAKSGEQIDIETIGRKGRDFFRRRYPAAIFDGGEVGGDAEASEHEERKPRQKRRMERKGEIELTGDHPGILDKLNFDRVAELGGEIVDRYIHEEIDAAYIVFNEFKSVISQRVVVERILPILEVGERDIAQSQEMAREERERAAKAAATAGVSPRGLEEDPQAKEEAEKFGTAEVDYIYEQPPPELLDGLLRQYVTSQLYRAMVESVAAEHAARMTAMDSATNNASEIIDRLTLTMNRVRQAAITKEIIEIVSGAGAL